MKLIMKLKPSDNDPIKESYRKVVVELDGESINAYIEAMRYGLRGFGFSDVVIDNALEGRDDLHP